MYGPPFPSLAEMWHHAAGQATNPNEVTILLSPSDLCSSKKWGPLQFCDALPAFACFRPAVLPPHALPARLVSPIFASFLRDADVTDLGRIWGPARLRARLWPDWL